MRQRRGVAVLASGLVLAVCVTALVGTDVSLAASSPGRTVRVSLATDGTQGNSHSYEPSVSSNIAFTSLASNLVAGDTNGLSDVFVRNTRTATTRRVSVAFDRRAANGDSYGPSVSSDGRYIAFTSYASNLVPGDTNLASDVFVHDTSTGTTRRVSIATDGTQANDGATEASMSGNGRYIAFSSYASNLVPGDTNLAGDVFVHDMQTATTTRVSVATNGAQADASSLEPSMSWDGTSIAFSTNASNLVPGDTNDDYDVFVRDTDTATTTRVSVATNGTQANENSFSPSISGEGGYVAFDSFASNLVPGDTNANSDVFVRGIDAATTTRVSVATNGTQANDYSTSGSVSDNARYIAFLSAGSNLVPGDTNGFQDVFVRDTQTAITTRISVSTDGTQANQASLNVSMSPGGRYIAFDSPASNLVPGDRRRFSDVFVRDRGS